MIPVIIMLALFNCCLLLCFKKWGWLDYYQAHYGHIFWLPAADCLLCLSFWLTFITGPLAFFLWLLDILFILVPFCVAALCALIISNMSHD